MSILRSKRFVQGLIVLLLIYTAYFLLAEDYFAQYAKLGRKTRHLILWTGIVLVYLEGIYIFKVGWPRWVNAIWHLVHIILIPLLLLLGIIDWSIGGLPMHWRHLAHSVSETLVSPVLYVGLALLVRFIPTHQMGDGVMKQ